jgi:hypothetical protein
MNHFFNCKKTSYGNQQLNVKKKYSQSGVTFFYFLCLNSHNNQKTNNNGKSKESC